MQVWMQPLQNCLHYAWIAARTVWQEQVRKWEPSLVSPGKQHMGLVAKGATIALHRDYSLEHVFTKVARMH